MRNLITKRIKKAIKEKVFPGCVVGIVRKSGERIVLPFGRFTYDSHSKRMREDSIFDVASVTKSIPTASLALKLIENKKLGLQDNVIKYIPELKNSFRDEVFVKHLLTHTICYKTDSSLSLHKDKKPQEILKAVYEFDYRKKPGTHYAYTNANAILLGLIIERITRKKLDSLANKVFFKPLRMSRTSFYPERIDKREVVPTEFDRWRGRLIQGEVHDESAWSIGREKVVGSAGLFSTVPDLLTFLEMLLDEGEYKGTRYFEKKTVKMMYTNQIGYLNKHHGLGWELFQRRYMGKRCGPKTFGKTGFTGCVVICDIFRGVAIVLLSNYIYPKRKPNAAMINKVRKDISDIVFSNVC